MPKHQENRTLPYSQAQLFDVVADVAKYPEFLPWCQGARIWKREENIIYADLIIGFKMFREQFTSKVTLNEPDAISVDYIKGPLKHLTNEWHFIDNQDGSCTIDFMVDFEFKNSLFERLVGGLFTEAVHHMIQAFEKRADVLYG